MRLFFLLFSVILIQIAQISYPTQAQNYGLTPSEQANHSAALSQALLEKAQETLKKQNQQSEKQHAQDLQIMTALFAISIGLGCVLVTLSVVFIKNKLSRTKVTDSTNKDSTKPKNFINLLINYNIFIKLIKRSIFTIK